MLVSIITFGKTEASGSQPRRHHAAGLPSLADGCAGTLPELALQVPRTVGAAVDNRYPVPMFLTIARGSCFSNIPQNDIGNTLGLHSTDVRQNSGCMRGLQHFGRLRRVSYTQSAAGKPARMYIPCLKGLRVFTWIVLAKGTLMLGGITSWGNSGGRIVGLGMVRDYVELLSQLSIQGFGQRHEARLPS